jgi:hypothetical protein
MAEHPAVMLWIGVMTGWPTPARTRRPDRRDIGTLYRLLGRVGVSQRQIAQLTRQSATAYAVMEGSDEADRYLAEANDGWAPQHGD